jgi:hypothetical protein
MESQGERSVLTRGRALVALADERLACKNSLRTRAEESSKPRKEGAAFEELD